MSFGFRLRGRPFCRGACGKPAPDMPGCSGVVEPKKPIGNGPALLCGGPPTRPLLPLPPLLPPPLMPLLLPGGPTPCGPLTPLTGPELPPLPPPPPPLPPFRLASDWPPGLADGGGPQPFGDDPNVAAAAVVYWHDMLNVDVIADPPSLPTPPPPPLPGPWSS